METSLCRNTSVRTLREKQNIVDFLDDLERAVRGDATEYFLGSVVNGT